MFAQAATEAGIPDGVINIVTGAGKDGQNTSSATPTW